MAQEPEEPLVEEEDGGPIKPFLDHLEDLRWVLIKCISATIIGMSLCMAGAPYVVKFLQKPLPSTMRLEMLGPLDGFWISVKVGLFAGLILALPYMLYVIGEFVLPALKRTEKKYFLHAVTIGAGLFLAGATLCYFVMLPISLGAVVKFNAWLGIASTFWRANAYFSFVCWFIVGMGLSFEMPVILLTLVKLDIISHKTLIKSRRYFVVINLVVCSFITPDFVSTFFMILPMQVLFEICILISAYWERQKKRAEAALLTTQEPQNVSD
ncbi:MAG TPA: twin-arginine translocase subunit TatC [Candidatus Binatia bacterium]|nr:twin-arginine translocase subunit TatC [Candidatus Binatia bacterium]